jgi:uncharacterized protein YbcI
MLASGQFTRRRRWGDIRNARTRDIGGLRNSARPVLEALVQEVTGAKPVSLHHDISTVTGEEVMLFTLAGSPGA